MKNFLLFLFLILIDLVTKKLIIINIEPYNFIPLLPFFDLVNIRNYGVSFGLFSGIVPSWLLVLLGLIIVGVIFYLMIIATDKTEKIAFLVIISGALSNILDRLINGYVIDFIYLNYNKFAWPAFNFADIYITIGILMILIKIFKKN